MPIPFYLVAGSDPTAERQILALLNQRLDLGIDLSDLDEEIKKQNEIIAEVRNSFPDIDESIRKLETSQRLTEKEGQVVVKQIEKSLKEKRDKLPRNFRPFM